MNIAGLRFHHFGLAVKKPDKAIPFLRLLGYTTGETVFDSLQNVNLIMCESPSMPSVEVIYPTDIQGGPLDNLLKQYKELIYHTCYTTQSITKSVTAIKQSGFRVMEVSAPKPAILFDNRLVAFYQVVGFGLIELLETEE